MGTHISTSDLDIWTEQVGQGPDVLLIGGLGDTVESWQSSWMGWPTATASPPSTTAARAAPPCRTDRSRRS
jgi:hypothetical protein